MKKVGFYKQKTVKLQYCTVSITVFTEKRQKLLKMLALVEKLMKKKHFSRLLTAY